MRFSVLAVFLPLVPLLTESPLGATARLPAGWTVALSFAGAFLLAGVIFLFLLYFPYRPIRRRSSRKSFRTSRLVPESENGTGERVNAEVNVADFPHRRPVFSRRLRYYSVTSGSAR